VLNFATRPFYQVADRILGTQFLQDIAEFFILFQSMYEGFVRRARAVEKLLHDRRTTFVVVSTLEPAPAHEAEFFIQSLDSMQFHLGALVLNKVLPAYLLDPVACRAADELAERSEELAAGLDAGVAGGDAVQTGRVLSEIAESFQRFHVVAQREAEERAELAAVPEVVASVPYFDSDIHDLAGLLRLGEALWA